MTDETVTITRATYERLCDESFLYWELRWRCILTNKTSWIDDARDALHKVPFDERRQLEMVNNDD